MVNVLIESATMVLKIRAHIVCVCVCVLQQRTAQRTKITTVIAIKTHKINRNTVLFIWKLLLDLLVATNERTTSATLFPFVIVGRCYYYYVVAFTLWCICGHSLG